MRCYKMEWHNRYGDRGWLESYRPTAIVTGAKEFSIGEAIVLSLLDAVPNINVISISRNDNRDLRRRFGDRVFFVPMDLNPLNYRGGLDEFQDTLYGKIDLGLKHFQKEGDMEPGHIDFLFNNAGIYDFGSLTKTSNDSISNLVGVNYLGHVMTAKTVMKLNEDNNFDNSRNFRLCEVGSFQGVDVRGGRPVYAPSKAAGLDFCQSLTRGNEAEVVSYIAVGPVDTYMLHANHWSTKAGGDKQFIDSIFSSDSEAYKAIFIDGNQQYFESYISNFDETVQAKLKETYSKYLQTREKYAKIENFATELTAGVGRNIVKRMLQSSKDWPSDIVIYNRQWNSGNNSFFNGYLSIPLDPSLERGYDKLSRIIGGNVNEVDWKEV